MRNLQIVSSLLTSLLLGSMAFGQTSNLPEAPQPQDSTATTDPLIPATTEQSTSKPSQRSAPPVAEDRLVSQSRPFPRFPRGTIATPRGRGYPALGPPPPPPPLAGTLIGFGVGFLVGACDPSDDSARGRAVVGLLGGLVGAALGALIDSGSAALDARRWRGPEDARQRKKHRPGIPQPSESAVEASAATPPSSPVPHSADFSDNPRVREVHDVQSATTP